MSFLEKLGKTFGIIDDIEDDDYNEIDDFPQASFGGEGNNTNDNIYSNPNSNRFGFPNAPSMDNAMPQPSMEMESPYNSYGSRPSNMKSNPKVTTFNSSDQIKMIVINPENYDEAREICDYIRGKKPVVVNLESMDFETAQRVMDFLCGSCYSLNGNIQRVAKNIFIVAPDNIDVTSDYKSELKGKNNSLSWMSFNKQNQQQSNMGQMPANMGSSPFSMSRG